MRMLKNVTLAIRLEVTSFLQAACIPCHEIRGDDASPHARVEHGQELEQLSLCLRLLHQDCYPDQIVIRHREIDDIFSLGHDGQRSQSNVGVLEKIRFVKLN